MALTFEEVDEWTRKTGALETLREELSQRTSTMATLQDQLADIRRLEGWEGSAAHAARQSFDPVDDDLIKGAAAVGAVHAQVGETIADLTKLQASISDAKHLASTNGFTIQFNGNVVDLCDLDDKANASEAELLQHERVGDQLRQMVSDIVSKGNEIEAEASRVLWAANSGDVGVDGLKDVEGAVNAGALFALEPAASPEQVNEWWNGLGTDQQNWIATHRPDWVRNRDGIPTDVRNETNRTFLDTERTRLQDQLTREQQSHPNPNQPPYGVPAQLLQRQIAVLDKLDKTLEQKDTYLIGLDTTGESLKTIVSVGNPDEADNVAVTIPGMGSQIDAGGTIEGMVREGSLMQSEVMTQLDAAGRGHETVATVAWLGYDTPPGLAAAGSDSRAVGAAPALSQYLGSIDATSSGATDPNLTLVGHSYGSLTAGLALQDGASSVVDDYVAYGSPGFYAMDEADLGMQQGHVYVMQAPDDPIRVIAETPWYGGDPADGSFTQLSTAPGTTPDGVYREGSSGHSEYPRPFTVDDQEWLRVSGYNTAAVIAGLPESAVRK
ncbi:alpha/beta hydrolase [Mycolicibacterium diernhoferi]|nr:alpha/beta hydrolase [Mycolicibacterium diernhoferi]QYL20737.1 alpha/beta hydrolase family protein [Mycolicibacterium diernhoferi]